MSLSLRMANRPRIETSRRDFRILLLRRTLTILHRIITMSVPGIMDSSVSSTSVAVVGSSATGEGAVYQAYFFPKVKEGVNELKWLGYTQGLFVDSFGHLREDTNGDGKLVYRDDKIIVPYFDTSSNSVKVKVYS